MSAIDLEALLQEISPEAPSGDNLEYDADFIALEQKAKGTPEQQIGSRIEPAQPPNWREVQKSAEALLARTRDLRPLLNLIHALLHQQGLIGLQEGLALLEGAVLSFWGTLHPQLDPDDDNDPTQRVNLLMSICDFESVLRPVNLIPIVESRAIGRFSLRDVQIATGKLPAPADESEVPKLSSIEAAFRDADIESLKSIDAAVAGSLASLRAIEDFVTDQVGVGDAPNFSPLTSLLKEIRHVLQEHTADRGVGAESAGDEQADSADAGSAGGRPDADRTGGLGAINNRQDVIRALNLICDYYSRFEPSSPIPLLLQRAQRLVSKDFLEIIKDLAPDGLSQVEIIKGPDPDEATD